MHSPTLGASRLAAAGHMLQAGNPSTVEQRQEDGSARTACQDDVDALLHTKES